MSLVQRTPDGFIVTKNQVKLATLVIAAVASLLTGVVAAVRFIDRAADSVPRQEFALFTHADSEVHAAQRIHDAFQDSVLSQQGRDNHAVTCYVYRNPLPFCSDRVGFPVRPQQP